MKTLKYIVLTAVCALFMQCSEDFIDLDNPSGKTLGTLFTNKQNAEKALTGIYHNLWTHGYYKRSNTILGDSPSDNIKELGDAGGYGIATLQLNTFIFNDDNFLIDQRWKDIYQGLFRINIFIENVDTPDFQVAELDENTKSRWIAEAKFFRALSNFLLVTNFGEAPLILTPLSPDEVIGIEKNTVEELWTQIEKDLNEAIPNLPPTYSEGNIGRVTKGAANALLGRAHLYQSEWTESINASKKVVDSELYDLYQGNYADLFNGNAENSVESVFEAQSIDNGFGVGTTRDFGLMHYYWSPNFSWAANFFGPSQSIIDAFAARPADKRRAGSFYMVGVGDSIDSNGDGQYSTFPSTAENNRSSYINEANVRKYLPAGINLANRSQYKINYNIIRYAEVLLNYAEALNEDNQPDEALKYVNMIRERAGMPNLATTDQAQLRDSILLERRLELCFEGHRFFDLVRTGRATDVLGPMGYSESNNKYFPIPRSEKMINDHLD